MAKLRFLFLLMILAIGVTTPVPAQQASSVETLEEEAASLLSRYIQIDTTNPPGDEIKAGLVMYATGRNPNTHELGLHEAGVHLGANGEVVVDEWSQSNVPSIYGVGDVTDRLALTPVAIREGHAFADTVFGGKPTAVNHDGIPTAVFSQPEIGTVGHHLLAQHVGLGRAAVAVDVHAVRLHGDRDGERGRGYCLHLS